MELHAAGRVKQCRYPVEMDADGIVAQPLSAERWPDLEKLFGPRGACGGCWCMWWRLTRSAFTAGKGDRHRDALRQVVESGEVPGVLLYVHDQPVGWCSVAPRKHFPVLGRSRSLPLLDDAAPWSVVCLFVQKDHRRAGMSGELLHAAAQHAAGNGAQVLEGYPVEPRKSSMPDAFAWTGTASAFRRAGFSELGRGPTGRLIMRRTVDQA